jgi:hypothetical protein
MDFGSLHHLLQDLHHGFEDSLLEVCAVDEPLALPLLSFEFPCIAPSGDGRSVDIVPPCFIECHLHLVGGDELFLDAQCHGSFHHVGLLIRGMSSPSLFCVASMHSYSMPSTNL